MKYVFLSCLLDSQELKARRVGGGCLRVGRAATCNRKIPKNKPRGLYFSKALFEGLICGGAYIRRGLSTEGDLRFKN